MDRNGHGSHLVWMSGSNEMRLAGLWQKSHANWYLKKKKRIVFDKQLLKTANGYVNDKQQLRVQVEWDETLLLFQATYHKYDDVGRIHNYQMRLVPFFFSFVISFCFEWGWEKKETFRTPHTYHLCLFKNKRNRHDMTKRRNAHKLQEPDRHTCLSVHSSTVPEVAGGISKAAVTLIKRSTSSLIALAHKRGRSRSIHTHIDIYRRN